jgi:glycine dehydrogenase subunit 1
MTFFPHTPEERREMLATIGVPDLEALFDDIPSELRFPALSLPRALSELELKTEIEELARRNTTQDTVHSFLGGGSYRHFIPATVDYVLQRGEFYTSYTPYQPELSQGMLQAMFEYQTAICRLTGMDVSNASHYDGATSLAEAVLLCLDSVRDERARIVMAPSVHPHYRSVAETYLLGTDVKVMTPANPYLAATDLMDYVDEETAALVIQTPSFLGFVEDLQNIADRLHDRGALLIVVTDPISLGLFRPPGELEADVVVADGQPLGIAPSFGGPSVGIFATRKAFIRRLAGRLVGQTIDADGNRGYVLTLATREQHIRRAKATSNICTNAALGALTATVYLATLGDAGLRRVAELCFHKAHYAAEQLGSIPGIIVNDARPKASFFREFVLSLPQPADGVHRALREHHAIDCGLPLGRFYPEHDNKLLVAVTEMNTRAGIDQFAAALREVASE